MAAGFREERNAANTAQNTAQSFPINSQKMLTEPINPHYTANLNSDFEIQ
jgi:hypothetical protein